MGLEEEEEHDISKLREGAEIERQEGRQERRNVWGKLWKRGMDGWMDGVILRDPQFNYLIITIRLGKLQR